MHYANVSHQLDEHKSTGKRAACRMLLNLTPGVNLINILQTDITRADLESAKNSQVMVSIFLYFWDLRV